MTARLVRLLLTVAGTLLLLGFASAA